MTDESQSALRVLPPRMIPMETRDGVRLHADVHIPDAPGPFPVLLMRTRRGRRLAASPVQAHPSWYASQGYIVAVQDVRGTGTSEGGFEPVANEAADGADAVAWAAALPGGTGTVGMLGVSYQATAQLLALAGGAPALKAACPAMARRVDWTAIEPSVPMLHVGGWFDATLDDVLACWKDLSARAGAPQHLVVGPWTRRNWGRRLGDADFGPEAPSGIDLLQVAWFDQFLKGIDTGVLDRAAVELFDINARIWRRYDGWPGAGMTELHLASTGLAAATPDDGILTLEPPEWSVDTIVCDAGNPATGGVDRWTERSRTDGRADVACYLSAPSPAPAQISGDVAVELHLRADRPDAEVEVALSQVMPDGRSFVLVGSRARIGPDGHAGPLRLPLGATCAMVSPGNTLRLSVTAAPAGEEAAPVTLSILGGRETPSRLLLPLVDR